MLYFPQIIAKIYPNERIMSRSFTPPDTLSEEDRRAMADVRRSIWTNSFQGLAYGGLSALVGHTIASFTTRSKKLNRNTALFSFLLGGTMGSFLAATVAGKNEVHLLHPIFQLGAKPKKSVDPNDHTEQTKYMERYLKGKKQPVVPEPSLDDFQSNRLLRRQTLQNALENQSGLNDSHGGHWVEK